MKPALLAFALALALGGCDKSQTLHSGHASDTPPWDAASDPFVAPGWKAGEKASWESQIRNRTAAQNEYLRTPPRS